MAQSQDQRDDRLRRASDVLASFLRDHQGTTPAVERLCQDHPELADELRMLHAGLSLGQTLATSKSVHEALSEHLEDGTEVEVTLNFDAAESRNLDDTMDSPAPKSSGSAFAASAKSGSENDRYQIQEQVAQGGMGVIYRVFDRSLSRTLAMKVIRVAADAGSADTTQIQSARFLEEAQVTAQLDHPGIVPVHEMGVNDQGQMYFVMKLVRGRDLGKVFEQAREEKDGWNLTRAVGALVKACQAIAYAHAKNVIHRDLKPSNIMVGRFGEVYVMDWGLAKIAGSKDLHEVRADLDAMMTHTAIHSDREREADSSSESPLLTTDGSVIGTPAYMPPEQARGDIEEIDQTSDIYSLGAILYNLLTGRSPYIEPNVRVAPHAILARVLDGPPTPISQLNRRAPGELIAICEKAMAREKSDRYDSAQEAAEDLQAYLDGHVVSAYQTGAMAEFRSWVRRNKGWAASLVAALVLATCGLLAFALVQRSARQRIAREHYFGNVAAAQNYIESGHVAEAQRLLLECDPEYRHWEWGHCLYLCNQSTLTIQANPYSPSALSLARGGRRVMTRISEGIVKIWNADTGEELLRVGESGHAVKRAVFHPDGDVVATACVNGEVQLWDLNSGTEMTPPLGRHIGEATHLAFHSSGNWLASAGEDHAIKVWDLSAKRLLYEINESDDIAQIAFSPNGERLISNSAQGSTVWVAATGVKLFEAAIPREEYATAAMSPTGSQFATIEDVNSVKLWDAETGDHLLTLRSVNPVARIMFRPDGKYVGAIHQDGSATGWDCETGDHYEFSRSRVYDVAGSEDNQVLVTTSGELVATVWSAYGRDIVKVLRGHSQIVGAAAVSPDGGRIATADRDGVVKIWSPNIQWSRLSNDIGCTAVAISPNGETHVTGHWNGEVNIWDAASGRLLMRVERFFQQVLSLAFSPDGEYLAAAGGDGWVDVMRMEDAQTYRRLDGDGRLIHSIDYDPDGTRIAAASSDAAVKIWDVKSGERTHTLKGHGRQVWSVDFHPTKNQLASSGYEETVRIWDLETSKQKAAWRAGESQISCVTYSPRGDLIATSGEDRTARIWDAQSHKLLHPLESPAFVYSVAFSPDGKRLVGVSGEKQANLGRPAATLWDVVTGRRVFTMAETDGLLYRGRFSADGTRILAGNAALTGHAVMWEAFPWNSESGLDESLTTVEQVERFASKYWKKRSHGVDRAMQREPIVVQRSRSMWPRRDTATPIGALDLTGFYNGLLSTTWSRQTSTVGEGNNLASLPTGLVTLANTPFDVRGVVQLANGSQLGQFPEEVTGIPIRRAIRRFHLLHGTTYEESDGTVIGTLRIDYDDGEQREIELKYGQDLRDWYHYPNTPWDADNAFLAWTGQNLRTISRRASLRLYASVLENPRPEQTIVSVNYTSRLTNCGPFLIAITVDDQDEALAIHKSANQRIVDEYLAAQTDVSAIRRLADSWKHLGLLSNEHNAQQAFYELSLLLAKSTVIQPVRENNLRLAQAPGQDGPTGNDLVRRTNKLIPPDGSWRYLVTSETPAGNWYAQDFDDSAWMEGTAPLGYGEQNIATTIGFGDDQDNKNVTTYFRTAFNLDDMSAVSLARLSVTRDDSVIVYLNGKELIRDNLPETAWHTTFASKSQEPTTIKWLLPATELRSGRNVIAAEVHQCNRTSSDIYFAVELDAISLDIDLPQIEASLVEEGFYFPDQLRVHLHSGLRKKQ